MKAKNFEQLLNEPNIAQEYADQMMNTIQKQHF